MTLRVVGLIILLALSTPVELFAQKTSPRILTDAEVKKAIIAESIRKYPGNCPCPYNVAKNGSSCGKRSAWSKPGGYSPICYEKEVTAEMVATWRNRQK